MKIIATEKAPRAIGPYSQAVVAGGLLLTSGQGGVDPESGKIVEGGIKAETEQAIRNIAALYEAAGTGFDKVIKNTCFLAEMKDFAAFNEVYSRHFISRPARSCVAVKELPAGFLCEIETIASLD